MPSPAEQQHFKLAVYEACKNVIGDRMAALQQKLDDLREMVAAETKSTAGDKYETARAMIHQEQEQTNAQLAAIKAQQSALQKIDPHIHNRLIIPGTLIYTDNGVFFISTGLGKLIVNDVPVWIISMQSPLGKLFAGNGADATIIFNNNTYRILQLL